MNQEIVAAVEKLVTASEAKFWHCPGTHITCCVLVLEGGFTVFGKVEVPAPNQEEAQRMAFNECVDELLRLEAFRQSTSGPRIQIAAASLLTK